MQPSQPTQRRLSTKLGKPCGFPRSCRLLAGNDFKQVFDKAKRVGNSCWTIYAWRHDEPRSRLGLAIAKRYVRRAHERNRLKRLARESFRKMQTQLIGLDLVVMSGKLALTSDNKTLNQQLVKLLTLFMPRAR
jgi:ribonuclease P protein component